MKERTRKNARKQEKCKTRHSKAGRNAHERQERSPAAKLQTRRQSSEGEQNKHEKTSPNAPHRGRNRRTSPNNRLAGHYIIIMVARHERKFGSDEQRRAQQSITSEQSKQAEPRLAEEMRSAVCGVWKIRCVAILDTSRQAGTNKPTPLVESETRPTKDTNQRPTTKLRADAPLKFKPTKEPGKKT